MNHIMHNTDLAVLQEPSRKHRSKTSVEEEVSQDDQSIANIVIITGLPNANNDIQIQALEVRQSRALASTDIC